MAFAMAMAANTARIIITGGVTVLSCLAVATPASASGTCDLVAASNGSDSASGSVTQPLRSAQVLAGRLAAGQTGCLRSGTYAADTQVKVSTPGVTLTSYPGEQATLRGRLWVLQTGDGVTISNLALDGRSPTGLPSPTINADDVVLRGNDITNYHTGICVQLGSPDTWGRAHRTLIEDNDIHDCGVLPATNQDHGIYVDSSDDAVIRGNRIYDNADRGIQLHPDAQHTLITGNMITGNGEGVIFSGANGTVSSNNIVEHNVIVNSRIRDNVDSWWEAGVGTGNVVHDNCIGGGPYDNGDGGIKGGPGLGFTATDNLLRVPTLADLAALTILPSDPCAAVIAGADATPAGSGGSGTATVTIESDRTSVPASTPLVITGEASGATAVALVTRKGGRWKRVGKVRARRNGTYKARIRIRRRGRSAVKAVAAGLRDSRSLKLRIK